MSVYKDKSRNKWKYDFVCKGKRYSGYCKLPSGDFASGERQAQRCEAIVREGVLAQRPEPKILPSEYTLAMAIQAYIPTVRNKSSWPSIKGYLREFIEYFGQDILITHINRRKLTEYKAWQEEQFARTSITKGDNVGNRERGTKRSPGTIKKHMNSLRAVLFLAHNTRDEETRTPLLDYMPVFPEISIPQHHPRPWNQEQIANVCANAPEHVANAIRIAILTGLRKSSVLSLKIDDVDLYRMVVHKGIHNKAKRDGDIPITASSEVFWRFLVQQAVSRGTPYLITHKPRGTYDWVPVKDIKTSFISAQKRAGISNPLRFHALKTTAITLAASAGADARTLQAIGDHSDYRTTLKHYVGETEERRKSAMEKVASDLLPIFGLPNKPISDEKQIEDMDDENFSTDYEQG